jgi:voltage-gated sodium channel
MISLCRRVAASRRFQHAILGGAVRHRWAWVYYVSFVVLAVFVVINLFIAIVINNLEAVKVEERAAHPEVPADAAVRIAEVRERLADVEATPREPKAASREGAAG